MDVLSLTILESMQEQLLFWIGLRLTWGVMLQHHHHQALRQLKVQLKVQVIALINGLVTTFVMMKTTTLIVILMVVIVVEMM